MIRWAMLILGIETSCDETSMSVLSTEGSLPVLWRGSASGGKGQKIKILSSVISSQIKIHAKYGGVYPALAAREHAKNIDKVLKLTLREAGLKSVSEVDLIDVTKGPGLAVALIVGITFAKTLAWKYKKPIVGINHLEGHIYSNWLPVSKKSSDLASLSNQIFPALNLIVSGGHTELVLMPDHGKYKLIGETVDDAAGEAFDKIARILGMGYPGGPFVSAEAERFSEKDGFLGLSLPRPMLSSKNFNFSFSGLKTAVLYMTRDLVNSLWPLEGIRSEIAHEAQQAIVNVLVSKTLLAAKQYKVKSVLLSGGVSANTLLRETLEKEISKIKGIKFFKPLMTYTTDNAAM